MYSCVRIWCGLKDKGDSLFILNFIHSTVVFFMFRIYPFSILLNFSPFFFFVLVITIHNGLSINVGATVTFFFFSFWLLNLKYKTASKLPKYVRLCVTK